jgi:hypothetical protein
MVKQNPLVAVLKEAVKDSPFRVRVRCFPEPSPENTVAWVFPEYGTKDRMIWIIDRLNKAGFRTKCFGKKGTSGEFIVDIVNPKDY